MVEFLLETICMMLLAKGCSGMANFKANIINCDKAESVGVCVMTSKDNSPF
jgi:hypothetical protein